MSGAPTPPASGASAAPVAPGALPAGTLPTARTLSTPTPTLSTAGILPTVGAIRAVPVLLVMAKAPVPGFAKTRLSPPLTPGQAADVAAASLLDTLDVAVAAAAALGGGPPVVALTGDVAAGARAGEITAALRRCRVVLQRGEAFAERLAAAHADASAGAPVVQIGMDTPQVDVDLLLACAGALGSSDAVLGPAEDGGWWVLGLRDPAHAVALLGVAMSTSRTHDDTLAALTARRLHPAAVPVLRDVDTLADAVAVAAGAPGSRFADAVRAALEARAGLAVLPGPIALSDPPPALSDAPARLVPAAPTG